ncbi:MAG TPA: GNAT family N-acetyltransferase [Acidimicrobiia bacterium]
MRIREATADDLPALRDIERDAGRMFDAIGMTAVADDEPFSIGELERYRRAGRAWVAIDDDDEPVGYVIAELLDGNAHVEQVSVRPANTRRGLGRALVERVVAEARALGYRTLKLDTLPSMKAAQALYASLGFVDTAAYNANPVAGVRFMALDLAQPARLAPTS